MSDVESTLSILASRFECPVFVHNTAMVRRHDGTLRERLKTVLTRRSRRIARDLVNRAWPRPLPSLIRCRTSTCS